MAAPAPLLFVNIGWQNEYKGRHKNDPTLGGHRHLKMNAFGHEAWNFAPLNGRLYGYIPHECTVNLERLGAPRNAETLDGVTVVWLARHPSNGQTVIVGWYKNATVHRHPGKVVKKRQGGIVVNPQVVAAADDSLLLHRDQRTFPIPTKKEPGCLGQSPVWYGRDDMFRATVRSFISTNGEVDPTPAPKTQATGGRQSDPEKRRLIEVLAISHATRYYQSVEGGKRSVISVERECLGWDLEASRGGETLLVEVKGVSGQHCIAELTPNEYAKLRSPAHRYRYVVFIVTGLGEGNPRSHIFRYDRESSGRHRQVWASADGEILQIKEAVAARLSVR